MNSSMLEISSHKQLYRQCQAKSWLVTTRRERCIRRVSRCAARIASWMCMLNRTTGSNQDPNTKANPQIDVRITTPHQTAPPESNRYRNTPVTAKPRIPPNNNGGGTTQTRNRSSHRRRSNSTLGRDVGRTGRPSRKPLTTRPRRNSGNAIPGSARTGSSRRRGLGSSGRGRSRGGSRRRTGSRKRGGSLTRSSGASRRSMKGGGRMIRKGGGRRRHSTARCSRTGRGGSLRNSTGGRGRSRATSGRRRSGSEIGGRRKMMPANAESSKFKIRPPLELPMEYISRAIIRITTSRTKQGSLVIKIRESRARTQDWTVRIAVSETSIVVAGISIR